MPDKYLQNLLRSKPNSLAVYVHFPWCISKCPYCDFNSHALRNDSDIKAYTNAIIKDIQTNVVHGYSKISSIFFGGGTPSLFPAANIAQVLKELERTYGFDHDLEITLEANPNSADQASFQALHDIGINRLSIGAQSFNDQQLKNLGRAHSSKEIHTAIAAAKAAGFTNINLDIMHGLPNQDINAALTDLITATLLEPNHISWYQLTIEPNTRFAAFPPKLPNHDLRSDIYDAGLEILQKNGYQRIEISAFCKQDQQAQHNLHVWAFGDYLGIGAGAHSKLKLSSNTTRQYRHYHPNSYIKNQNKIAENKQIQQNELLFEYMLNRARVLRPIDGSHLAQTTRLTKETINDIFQQAITDGLLQADGNDWQVTNFGLNHLDNLISHCFTEE